MGSVKDLSVIREPSRNECGEGVFKFSDRYSVFDWGGMPDKINDKGSALAIMATYFFDRLREEGIPSHFLGVHMDDRTCDFSSVESPFNSIRVKLVRVIEPGIKEGEYDYSVYKNVESNYLIPMEFIYRNSIPEGSSFWKRYRSGRINYGDLGNIEPNQDLMEPIFDVSTKLEEKDRYISWEEAKKLSCLSEDRISEVRDKLKIVNKIISTEVNKAGLINQDGKLEFAIDDSGKLIVVDALGTLDECRFLYNDLPLSKEILRKWYRRTEWYKEVKEAQSTGKRDWKEKVNSQPPHLPEDLRSLVSDIYRSVAVSITGKDFFDAPPVDEVVERISKYEVL